MNRKIIYLILGFIFIYSHQTSVFAETGTRIEGAGDGYPENVVWFSEPTEVKGIRQLLQNGMKAEALDKARKYVASISRVSGAEAKRRLYYGLNALCVASSSNGYLEEAVGTCNKAVNLFPSLWQAYNNRGAVYYISQNYDMALQDYRQALELVHDSEERIDIIRHNIKLTEEKLAGNS